MSSLKTTHRWVIAKNNPSLEAELSKALDIKPLVARIMVAHGISSVEEGRLFLSPSLERDWADPLVIPGMAEVADRMERAVRQGETIAVFGDFDVDGITSTCLLTEALSALGAKAHPFIPRRFDEGYGISKAALDRVVDACCPDVVVTVDNGIAARDEVSYLKERGIDLVVTDHHEPADLVPQGVPLTDPKLIADGPSHELAGAGVALKLVQVLGSRLGAPQLWRSLTEVAALGTVSDMMLLTPENRALVADGIAHMRATARPGYIALAALSRTDLSNITADGLSFSLIPRLNAAGRMADPAIALDLLMARDPVEAGRLAAQLESINQQRRDIESELTDEALKKVAETYHGERVIVAGGEGWHEGVKGIVASRLVNRYHVPALLFSIEDGVARGSGRSVGAVNLFEAVERCSDLLIRFGGHPGAVGVTCAAKNLGALRERLAGILAQVPEDDFEDKGEIAAVVNLSELTIDTIEQVSRLEPFGQGNRVPLLAAAGVTMENCAAVGKTGDHMRFIATDGAANVPAIMFRAPRIDRLVDCDSAVDLVFEAVAEHWQGRVKPKLMVKDILCRDAGDAEDGAGAGVGGVADASAEAGAAATVAVEPASSGSAGSDEPVVASRDRRSQLARLSYEELTRFIIHALIGTASPHRAQADALEALAQGKSVLAIMGTGRGKSLIFQVHAVREAILRNGVSVFVYPLRALVADQAFHLMRSLASLGVQAGVLTGESATDQRDRTFAQLSRGKLDILLTTPEFLAIHAERFAAAAAGADPAGGRSSLGVPGPVLASGSFSSSAGARVSTGAHLSSDAVPSRIGFVVIDEAHHMAEAARGDRSAYLELPSVLKKLGRPRVLACTATASQRTVDAIRGLLPIDRVVVDDAVRENLDLDDERNLASRENRLVSIVATGQKSVVYVNSRDQSVSLARTLRRRVPELGARIAFYNAGLTRADRTRVEDAFRDGRLTCIVSTSAFGEGVNLPDIRHVVLYHMPFGPTEFNQMSGRAGRDGKEASIHLLYSKRDAHINQSLLDAMAPQREELVTLYRALQTMWRRHRGLARSGSSCGAAGPGSSEPGDPSGAADGFCASNLDIAQMCLAIDARTPVDERSVPRGLGIFEELGFARVTERGGERLIEMTERPGHVDLTRSTRYLEGLRAQVDFSAFCTWALSASARDMLARINRPITPATRDR